ncbi:hypothetical protein ACFE04_026552 [Oxalis oulophora]
MSNVHKIVHISTYPLPIVHVLTLGIGSWRKISRVPHIVRVKTVVSTPGHLHWLCVRPYEQDLIISFSIETEEFRTTRGPKPRTSYVGKVYLSSWKQSLAAIYFLSSKNRIEVWVSKDYKNNEWIKEFKVTKTNLRSWFKEKGLHPPFPCVPTRLLGNWNSGFLFEIVPGEYYMLYNPTSCSFEILEVKHIANVGELNLFTPNIISLAKYGCMVIGKGILQSEDINFDRNRPSLALQYRTSFITG